MKYRRMTPEEKLNKILEIATLNLALEWGDTDVSHEWKYIIDLIKGREEE